MPTVLGTGAFSGIGYETARQLATNGATVIVHSPDTGLKSSIVDKLIRADMPALRGLRRGRETGVIHTAMLPADSLCGRPASEGAVPVAHLCFARAGL